MAKDWSVVAWAEQGELTLRHDEGLSSDDLPLIERKGTLSPKSFKNKSNLRTKHNAVKKELEEKQKRKDERKKRRQAWLKA